MNTPDYESIWQQSLIRVTDKFSLPAIVLRVDDAIIGTLGNFSVSTGKAKAKKSVANTASTPNTTIKQMRVIGRSDAGYMYLN